MTSLDQNQLDLVSDAGSHNVGIPKKSKKKRRAKRDERVPKLSKAQILNIGTDSKHSQLLGKLTEGAIKASLNNKDDDEGNSGATKT